jgi:RNase P/RNase MRP subunit p30
MCYKNTYQNLKRRPPNKTTITMEADEERLRNQQEFRKLMEILGVDQAQAAKLINEETSRTLTTRTIKTWLAAPTAATARKCPSWAVKVLRDLAGKRIKSL